MRQSSGATGPGTALAGSDFVSQSGTVTFLAGETTKQITVSVIGELVVEPDETFNVTLSNASSGLTIVDGLGVVAIVNDDVATASTVTVTATSGAEAGSPVTFTFSRTGAISATFAVTANASGAMTDLECVTPTVTGGTWNSATNTVTFNVNSSTVVMTFAVIERAAVEPTETADLHTRRRHRIHSRFAGGRERPTSPTTTSHRQSASPPPTEPRAGPPSSSLHPHRADGRRLIVNATRGSAVAADWTGPVAHRGSWNTAGPNR